VIALPVLVALTLQASAAPQPGLVARRAYLMGTQVALWVRADSDERARTGADTLLASLEESENALSTWRDTPFNRLNEAPEGVPATLEPALCALFREMTGWIARTDGAFDPAVGPLLDLWGVQSRPRVPTPDEIRDVLAVSRFAAWHFDADGCRITRPPGGRLDSGAFGKGEALDRAVALDVAGEWLIDLGGQVAAGGNQRTGGSPVGIAHPRHREQELFDVELRSGSLATSGGSERDQRSRGTRVGHIIDPRSGRPASFDGSVVVWHERGLVADILSTALYVMGPEKGRRWAEQHQIAACFLVPEGSRMHVIPTSAFTRLFGRGQV
jgi:FAD:protein FMN transferase